MWTEIKGINRKESRYMEIYFNMLQSRQQPTKVLSFKITWDVWLINLSIKGAIRCKYYMNCFKIDANSYYTLDLQLHRRFALPRYHFCYLGPFWISTDLHGLSADFGAHWIHLGITLDAVHTPVPDPKSGHSMLKGNHKQHRVDSEDNHRIHYLPRYSHIDRNPEIFLLRSLLANPLLVPTMMTRISSQMLTSRRIPNQNPQIMST